VCLLSSLSLLLVSLSCPTEVRRRCRKEQPEEKETKKKLLFRFVFLATLKEYQLFDTKQPNSLFGLRYWLLARVVENYGIESHAC